MRMVLHTYMYLYISNRIDCNTCKGVWVRGVTLP